MGGVYNSQEIKDIRKFPGSQVESMNSPIGPLAYASKYQNQIASLPSSSIQGKNKAKAESMTTYGLAQNT